MGSVTYALGTGGEGGGGLKTRTPTDVFTGANRNAAITARNSGLNAAALAEFDEDPNLAIILRYGGSDTYQVRRGGAWRDVTNIVRGERGPGPTDAQIDAGLARRPPIDSVVIISPGSLNRNNPPENIRAVVITRPNAFPNAVQLRLSIEGRIAAEVYDPAIEHHEIRISLNQAAKDSIRSDPIGSSIDITATLVDSSARVVHTAPVVALEITEDGSPLTQDQLDAIDSIDDARRLVGVMQWEVSPAHISGRAVSDFERTFRLNLEPIRFDFTDLYYEVYVEATPVHDRAQWVSSQHLDIAIDNTEATAIAAALPAAQDHIDFHLYFHTTSTSVPVVAATFRRVSIIEVASSGAGVDQTARDAAAAAAGAAQNAQVLAVNAGAIADAAQDAATTNAQDIAALETKQFPARLAIWPPNVAMNSGFQRNFKAILNELDEQVLRLDGGSTGTRFVNRFQIKTRNADRAEVLLHDEAWSFTTEGAQELEWNVSATEFNQLGTSVSTDYIEVWGEFRAVYGGGVNEPRGRTQPFVIGFGEEAEWPTTRGEATAAVDNASDIQYQTIGTNAALEAFLRTQATSSKPVLVLFTAAIDHTVNSIRYNVPSMQVRYFKARNTTGRNFFVLASAGSGQSAGQVMAAILAALPPFADIRLLPGALPGSQVPDNFYVELVDKLITREIDGLTLTIQGQTVQPHSSTPVANFNTEDQALVRFDISSVSDAISNGIDANDTDLIVDLTFSFTEGNDYRRRIILPVNNINAPRLNVGELDTITYNANITLDWLAPDMRSITLTGNITFAFSNIQVGRPLVLEVKQGTPGGQTVTWPSSVEWAGGSAEGPSSGAGDVDIFTLLPLSATRVIASALLDVS